MTETGLKHKVLDGKLAVKNLHENLGKSLRNTTQAAEQNSAGSR
jgi:hypothetical protein